MKHVDVASLTDDEARALHSELSYRFARTTAVRRDGPTAEESTVWNSLCAALGYTTPASFEQFIEKYGRKTYGEKLQILRKYLDEGCGEIMRRPVRVAVTERVLRCMVLLLQARDIPQNPAIVLNSLGFLAHAVNLYFPGYHEAKLLHRLAPVERTSPPPGGQAGKDRST